MLLLLFAEAGEPAVVDAATEREKWTGRIHVIQPDPGADGPRRTHIVAHDIMAQLSEVEVGPIPPHLDDSEDNLMVAVFEALPATVQPTAFHFDTPTKFFPVAFDDLGDGESALSVIDKIAQSARAHFFPLGDGSLRFQSQPYRATELSAYTFADTQITEMEVPTTLDLVFNRVKIRQNPRTSSGGFIALFVYTGSIELAAGQTIEIEGSYQNPDNAQETIGGTQFQTPVAGTDWVANEAEDGAGLNVTADVLVTSAPTGSSVLFTIENTHSATAFILPGTLQQRGIGLFQQSPVVMQSYTAKPYGERTITIEQPYATWGADAQAEADEINASYNDLSNQINRLMFAFDIYGDDADNDELIGIGTDIELGEVVTASEQVTLPTAKSGYVQLLEYTVTTEQVFVNLILAPRSAVERLVANDNLICGDADVDATGAAPETRIGFAEIGFSEVA